MVQGDTALIVIDVQNGFVNSSSAQVVLRVRTLVEECNRRRVPVVFTRFRNHAGSAYERLIGWDRLRTGPETDLVPELVTLATRVIEKAQYSAFTPEFEALVRQAGWRRLLFCGIATDGCVLKSAVDAFERDLRPIVVLDACASHGGNDVHECGLTLLGRFIGRRQLVDMTEALAMLDAS